MATDEDRLADELASLRLDRGTPERAARGGSRDGGRSSVTGWIVAVVALVALGIGGFFVYREGSGRIFSEDVELGAVTLMSPAQSDVTLVATGYVYARKKANVAPKTGGRLARFFVDEGSVVKEDQIIAELESADAQAQLAQVRADIAAARAKVERARADLADATTRFKREKELLASAGGHAGGVRRRQGARSTPRARRCVGRGGRAARSRRARTRCRCSSRTPRCARRSPARCCASWPRWAR